VIWMCQTGKKITNIIVLVGLFQLSPLQTCFKTIFLVKPLPCTQIKSNL